ncbi:MAG: UvrB/UvrC motif-containing protein [Planctomycetota bacterium]
MKCPFCKQFSVSVMILQPEAGSLLELGMCEFCAKKFNLLEGACPSIHALAAKLAAGGGADSKTAPAAVEGAKPVPVFAAPLVVPATLADKLKGFQKTGRFSGPEDYDVMERQLAMLFQKIQGGAQHTGKVPHVQKAVHAAKDQRAELEALLTAAVAAENYERAAQLRDEIKALNDAPIKPSEGAAGSQGPTESGGSGASGAPGADEPPDAGAAQ